MTFEEYVYDSLQGLLLHPHPEVPDLFEEGKECDRLYGEMLKAYARLCERLGVNNEDEDVEIIITNLQKIQRVVAYHMYYYGAKFKDHVWKVKDDFIK